MGRIEITGGAFILQSVQVARVQCPVVGDGYAEELLTTGAAEVNGEGRHIGPSLRRAHRTGTLTAFVEMEAVGGIVLPLKASGDRPALGEEGV
jgi:hypothetical protein